MERRVVVTGLGTVCPVGNNLNTAWKNLLQGVSGVDFIKSIPTETLSVQIAAEVKGFDPQICLEPKDVKKTSRFIQYALAAAGEAIENSGLNFSELGYSAGVCLGVGLGGLDVIENTVITCASEGGRRVSPFYIPSIISNLAPAWITIRYGMKGPNFTISSACASGTHAIGESFKMIQRGQVISMVTGGSESCITPTAISGFANMKALARCEDGLPQIVSRPFDKKRSGFVIGEGAGILVLEEYEHARKRNADIYAEVVGYGNCSDAYHLTKPQENGFSFSKSMELALNDGGVDPQEIDYINAHGTSTPFNDLYETMAIKRVFKEHAKEISINSTKSMTGHLLGGSGGLEAVVTVKSIKESMIHPTINYENPDPELDLDYTPNQARARSIGFALSNSFGFGGTNGTVVFRRI